MPGAVVGDGHDHSVVGDPSAQLDDAAARAIFQRIVDEVGQRAREQRAVGLNIGQAFDHRDLDPAREALRRFPASVGNFVEQLTDGERFALEGSLLGARDMDELVGEAEDARGLGGNAPVARLVARADERDDRGGGGCADRG